MENVFGNEKLKKTKELIPSTPKLIHCNRKGQRWQMTYIRQICLTTGVYYLWH